MISWYITWLLLIPCIDLDDIQMRWPPHLLLFPSLVSQHFGPNRRTRVRRWRNSHPLEGTRVHHIRAQRRQAARKEDIRKVDSCGSFLPQNLERHLRRSCAACCGVPLWNYMIRRSFLIFPFLEIPWTFLYPLKPPYVQPRLSEKGLNLKVDVMQKS